MSSTTEREYILRGRVVTADSRRPVADQLVIGDGRVVSELPGAAPSVHLPPGAVALPGFVDPHLHLAAMAAARLSVDLSGARSVGEILAAVAQARDAGWVRGRGYDAWRLAEGRPPRRDELDRVAPSVPVTIRDATGHEAVCNSAALRALDIDVADGRLHHADHLFDGVTPRPVAQLDRAIGAVSDELARAGITAVTDATHTNGASDLELLGRWHAEGRLRQRLEVMIGAEEVDAAGLASGATPAPGVTIGHVKIVPEALAGGDVADAVATARRHDFPVAIHTLDVGSLAAALDALGDGPPKPWMRDRLEHVALALPEQVAGIARARAAVVTQPSFLLHRGALYERELSEVERAWLYRAGSLVRAGVLVAASSDAPVVAPRPLEAVRVTVGREPAERLDRARALALVTCAAGRVGVQSAGTLALGAPADVVVLDGAADDASVLATVIGGEVAFDPEGLFAAVGAMSVRAG